MHGACAISGDDLRHALCTFVTAPIRWHDDFGWRPMSEPEKGRERQQLPRSPRAR